MVENNEDKKFGNGFDIKQAKEDVKGLENRVRFDRFEYEKILAAATSAAMKEIPDPNILKDDEAKEEYASRVGEAVDDVIVEGVQDQYKGILSDDILNKKPGDMTKKDYESFLKIARQYGFSGSDFRISVLRDGKNIRLESFNDVNKQVEQIIQKNEKDITISAFSPYKSKDVVEETNLPDEDEDGKRLTKSNLDPLLKAEAIKNYAKDGVVHKNARDVMYH